MRFMLGLSQPQLAEILGVHLMTVSKWERGKTQPGKYESRLMREFQIAGEKHKFRLRSELRYFTGVDALYVLLRAARSKDLGFTGEPRV